ASIAFDEPTAVVDGNVERVLHRISGKPLAGEKLWSIANHLLDQKRPGHFNQAMMELGATVCTPRAPTCLTCPIIALCATRGEFETAPKSPPQKKRQIRCALVWRQDKVLLVQRPPNASLMPGMWDLPELASARSFPSPLFTLRHPITVTNYTVHVHRIALPPATPGKWMTVDRLPVLP